MLQYVETQELPGSSLQGSANVALRDSPHKGSSGAELQTGRRPNLVLSTLQFATVRMCRTYFSVLEDR